MAYHITCHVLTPLNRMVLLSVKSDISLKSTEPFSYMLLYLRNSGLMLSPPPSISSTAYPLPYFSINFRMRLFITLHLKVFGCTCFFPFLGVTWTDKLEPNSIPCVFNGYYPTNKGYQCFDPINSKLYTPRHVCFLESNFFTLIHPNLLIPLSIFLIYLRSLFLCLFPLPSLPTHTLHYQQQTLLCPHHLILFHHLFNIL